MAAPPALLAAWAAKRQGYGRIVNLLHIGQYGEIAVCADEGFLPRNRGFRSPVCHRSNAVRIAEAVLPIASIVLRFFIVPVKTKSS